MSPQNPSIVYNGNIYDFMTDISVNLLTNSNIQSLQTSNDTLNILSDTNLELTDAWTTGPGSSAVAAEIAQIQAESGTSGSKQAAIDLNNFISTLTTQYPVSAFSQKVGAALLTLISLNYSQLNDISSGQASTDMNSVSAFNSIIQAKGNNEQQIGQNGAKTQSSVLQQLQSAMQTIVNCADAIAAVYAALASLLAQN